MNANAHALDWHDRGSTIDWPHLAFASLIAAWCAWYCWDAWSARADVENLILITPATLLALVLFAVIAVGCLRGARAGATPRKSIAAATARRIAGTMALLAGLAFTGPLLGFDVATFVYITASLLLLGERRAAVLILVPLLFCAVEIYGFNSLLVIPLPMLIFRAGR